MKRPVLFLLGLALPLLAAGQTAPDLVAQGNDKKIHGDLKGAQTSYTQAIAEATKVIAADPKNAAAYTNRGNAKQARGDLASALADYSKAIALDPHHVHAYINRGNIRNLQKKYHAAIDDYTAAIAIDPRNDTAYYDRAGAKRALGDYAGAQADYSRTLDLNDNDVHAYINRAVLEMAQAKWGDAKSDLEDSLELMPLDRQAYPQIYLWVIAIKEGKPEKDATAGMKQPPVGPNEPLLETWGWEISYYLGGRYAEKDFLDLAKSYVALHKDRGQVAQAWYYVGLKRQLAGDTAGAAKAFAQCVKLGSPSLHEFILASEELKGAKA